MTFLIVTPFSNIGEFNNLPTRTKSFRQKENVIDRWLIRHWSLRSTVHPLVSHTSRCPVVPQVRSTTNSTNQDDSTTESWTVCATGSPVECWSRCRYVDYDCTFKCWCWWCWWWWDNEWTSSNDLGDGTRTVQRALTDQESRAMFVYFSPLIADLIIICFFERRKKKGTFVIVDMCGVCLVLCCVTWNKLKQNRCDTDWSTSGLWWQRSRTWSNKNECKSHFTVHSHLESDSRQERCSQWDDNWDWSHGWWEIKWS